MKDAQQEAILTAIIEEHIQTGFPVGSAILAEKYNLDISPATIRQRMTDLESDEYIFQPHTSAGRVPSAKAYDFYLETLPDTGAPKTIQDQFNNIITNKTEESLRLVAKELAQISGLAVFWAFWKRNLYYTGVSNLLHQPEFSQMSRVYDVSAVIDEMDEIIDRSFTEIGVGVNVLVGPKSPFGAFTGAILAKYKTDRGGGLFGIIGPLRMDYKKNIPIIKYIYSKL